MPNTPMKKIQRQFSPAQMLGGRVGTYGSDHPAQSIVDWTNMITHVRRKAGPHDYDTIGLEAVVVAREIVPPHLVHHNANHQLRPFAKVWSCQQRHSTVQHKNGQYKLSHDNMFTVRVLY